MFLLWLTSELKHQLNEKSSKDWHLFSFSLQLQRKSRRSRSAGYTPEIMVAASTSTYNQTFYTSLWIITIQFNHKSGLGAINLGVGLSERRQEWMGWRLLHQQLTHISPDQPSFLAPLTLHFINDNEQCTNLTLQACCQEPTRVPRLIRQSQK